MFRSVKVAVFARPTNSKWAWAWLARMRVAVRPPQASWTATAVTSKCGPVPRTPHNDFTLGSRNKPKKVERRKANRKNKNFYPILPNFLLKSLIVSTDLPKKNMAVTHLEYICQFPTPFVLRITTYLRVPPQFECTFCFARFSSTKFCTSIFHMIHNN